MAMEVVNFFDETFIIAEEIQAARGKGTCTVLKEAKDKEKACFGSGAFGTIRFGIETVSRAVAFG